MFIKQQWITLSYLRDAADVNIQDQRDTLQRYFYGFLKTSDYIFHDSTHNSGIPFICEKPGQSFQFYSKTIGAIWLTRMLVIVGTDRCHETEHLLINISISPTDRITRETLEHVIQLKK